MGPPLPLAGEFRVPPRGDEPALDGEASWKLAFADRMLDWAHRVQGQGEEPTLTVRERLSRRGGRLHIVRAVRRAASSGGAPSGVELPGSDDERVLFKKKKRRKSRRSRSRSRDRGRGREKRGRSESSDESSSSSSSVRLFRKASSGGAGLSRSQRSACPEHVGHGAVTAAFARGARMTQVDVYKKLPAVYPSWHALKLEPRLRAARAGPGTPRRARLCARWPTSLFVGGFCRR